MQFSPKLKKAMEEIKVILKRHDIAAHVVLHTPGNSEYLLAIEPSYSVAKLTDIGTIHFKAKKADYNNEELRLQRIADTANMLNLLSTVGGENLLGLIRVSEEFDKLIDADHDEGSHTSHNTQNN